MKSILLSIFVLISLVPISNGQSKELKKNHLKIDTISIISDSVLAKVSIYTNDIMAKEIVGYLFPDKLRIPRFPIARKYFRKTINVDRVIRHGKSIEYSVDSNKKVTEYIFDTLIKSYYLDKNNLVITSEQFKANKLTIICTTNSGMFLIKSNK